MKDENDMPMSGDGSAGGEEPVVESPEEADEKPKKEKPLKIRGTLNDVLKVAMNVKPKVNR